MKNTGTYMDLFKIILDLDQQTQGHASFRMLHGSRIDWFKKTNGERIRVMTEFNQKLADKYCQKDANGRPVLAVHENGGHALQFLTPEDRTAYEAEFKEFMNRDIDIFT